MDELVHSPPTPQQWLKDNPRSSINEYYREFGRQTNVSPVYTVGAPVVSPMPSQVPSPVVNNTSYTNINYVVAAPKKSIPIGLLLTFLFGPLGLFYASVWGAIFMILIDVAAFALLMSSTVSLSVLGGSFAAIGVIGGLIWLVMVQWPACMLWALIACIKNNRKANETAFKTVKKISV